MARESRALRRGTVAPGAGRRGRHAARAHRAADHGAEGGRAGCPPLVSTRDEPSPDVPHRALSVNDAGESVMTATTPPDTFPLAQFGERRPATPLVIRVADLSMSTGAAA